MIEYFEDVFWFTDNVLSKDLGILPGNTYNLFIPNPLSSIKELKELYYSGNREDYYRIIEKLRKMQIW